MDCNNQVNTAPSPLLSTLNMFFSSPCKKKKKMSSLNKLIPQLLLTAHFCTEADSYELCKLR